MNYQNNENIAMKKFIAGMSILALIAVASPASATWWDWNNSDINVNVTNGAYVKNDVDTTASTGGNSANGGDAGNTTYGGNVRHSDDRNTAGNTSNANAGSGGTVVTGDAVATSNVGNDVNSNDVKIKVVCGCENNVDDVNVNLNNGAKVKNYVDTKAKTGHNDANGGNAGNQTTGGNVRYSDDDNTAGNTSNANAGSGGVVVTGWADAYSTVVNVVNSNVVRIRR